MPKLLSQNVLFRCSPSRRRTFVSAGPGGTSGKPVRRVPRDSAAVLELVPPYSSGAEHPSTIGAPCDPAQAVPPCPRRRDYERRSTTFMVNLHSAGRRKQLGEAFQPNHGGVLRRARMPPIRPARSTVDLTTCVGSSHMRDLVAGTPWAVNGRSRHGGTVLRDRMR